MEVDYKQIVSDIKRRVFSCIGSGSGRIVFDLGNGTVIKVAKNIRGVAQNQAEYQIFSECQSNLFAKVLNVSDDYKLLIMEKAERIRSISYVWKYFNVRSNRELRRKEELIEIYDKYNLLLSDFGRSVNWGQINDKPVIIDYGFTKKIARKYY